MCSRIPTLQCLILEPQNSSHGNGNASLGKDAGTAGVTFKRPSPAPPQLVLCTTPWLGTSQPCRSLSPTNCCTPAWPHSAAGDEDLSGPRPSAIIINAIMSSAPGPEKSFEKDAAVENVVREVVLDYGKSREAPTTVSCEAEPFYSIKFGNRFD